METIEIDVVTAFVAAFVYMLIGAFWYSKLLFGKTWEKLAALPSTAFSYKWLRYLIAFLSAYIMAVFLSIVEAFMGSASTMDGVYIGIGIWLGFIATTQLSLVLWGKKPFRLYLIDNGFFFCGYAVMGGIIGA